MPWLSFDSALLAARAAFLVFSFTLAAIAFAHWRRAGTRAAELRTREHGELLVVMRHLEQHLAELQRQVARLELLGSRTETQLTSLAGQLDVLPKPEPATSAPSYQIAIRLARAGAASEELMASCGLTRQESELIAKLHGPDKRTRTAAA